MFADIEIESLGMALKMFANIEIESVDMAVEMFADIESFHWSEEQDLQYQG